MASDVATKTGLYAQRLLDNEYVQGNLANGVERLRAAYERASKRRVEPTRDEKLRRQLREAATSLTEAASALKAGRTKPKRKRRRTTLVVLVVGAGGAAAVIAAKKKARGQEFEVNRPQTTATAGAEVVSVT
jgi:hypothetical protein